MQVGLLLPVGALPVRRFTDSGAGPSGRRRSRAGLRHVRSHSTKSRTSPRCARLHATSNPTLATSWSFALRGDLRQPSRAAEPGCAPGATGGTNSEVSRRVVRNHPSPDRRERHLVRQGRTANVARRSSHPYRTGKRTMIDTDVQEGDVIEQVLVVIDPVTFRCRRDAVRDSQSTCERTFDLTACAAAHSGRHPLPGGVGWVSRSARRIPAGRGRSAPRRGGLVDDDRGEGVVMICRLPRYCSAPHGPLSSIGAGRNRRYRCRPAQSPPHPRRGIPEVTAAQLPTRPRPVTRLV